MKNQLTLDFPIHVEATWNLGKVDEIHLFFKIGEKLIPFPDELYNVLTDLDIEGLKEYLQDQRRIEENERYVDQLIMNACQGRN